MKVSLNNLHGKKKKVKTALNSSSSKYGQFAKNFMTIKFMTSLNKLILIHKLITQ